MTTHAHQIIGERLRTLVKLIGEACHQPKYANQKKAKAARHKPNHRTIVFFEMP